MASNLSQIQLRLIFFCFFLWTIIRWDFVKIGRGIEISGNYVLAAQGCSIAGVCVCVKTNEIRLKY